MAARAGVDAAMKPPRRGGESMKDGTEEMDESKDPLEESGGTVSEEDEVDDAVLDDMDRSAQSSKDISQSTYQPQAGLDDAMPLCLS